MLHNEIECILINCLAFIGLRGVCWLFGESSTLIRRDRKQSAPSQLKIFPFSSSCFRFRALWPTGLFYMSRKLLFIKEKKKDVCALTRPICSIAMFASWLTRKKRFKHMEFLPPHKAILRKSLGH